jgi:DNA repair exonuclease SbcCD ATPase subunit
MVYSNLTLMIDLPPQSSSNMLLLTAIISVVGILISAVVKYGMERKNKLIRAYSQLIGKKFSILQAYTNMLHYTCDIYYNQGLINSAENLAEFCQEMAEINGKSEQEIKKLEEESKRYIDEVERIDKINEPNKELYYKELENSIKDIESLWKTIGIIDGLLKNNDKILDDLINDIENSQNSLDNFQRTLINETRKGLPDSYINKNGLLKSHWKENKANEIDTQIEIFKSKMDAFSIFIKKEKNKPWWKFLK